MKKERTEKKHDHTKEKLAELKEKNEKTRKNC